MQKAVVRALAVAGAITGVLAGLFGVGGGAIMVPVLFEVFLLLGTQPEIAMPMAVGTSLAIIIPTSIRSARGHYRKGAVDMSLLRAWALPILIGVAIGSLVAMIVAGGGPSLSTALALQAVFALAGLLAGLGGVFHVAYLQTSDPNAGIGLELSAIAAVVIGGTSLMGGRGSVVNSFFGVLIIAVLQAGLAQLGATEPTKRVVTGAVIVLAVIADAYRHHYTRRRAEIA